MNQNQSENYSGYLDYNSTLPDTSPHNLVLVILLPFKILLVLLTTVLNLLIIWVILIMTKKRTYSNFIFVSMAFADLIIGAVSMSFMTIFTTYGYWPLGYVPCVIWVVNDYSCCAISLLNLTLICAHRYSQITSPAHTTDNLTKKRVAAIIGIWLIAYGSWLISVVAITSSNFVAKNCYYTFTFAYVFSADLFAFLIPIFLILVMITLTSIALGTKRKQFRLNASKRTRPLKLSNTVASERVVSTFTVTNTYGGNTHESNANSGSHHPPSSPKQNIDKDKRAFLCLASIALNILVNWGIFIVAWPLSAYCSDCVNAVVYEIGYWQTYATSTVNPIILIIFHSKFRSKIGVIFKKMF